MSTMQIEPRDCKTNTTVHSIPSHSKVDYQTVTTAELSTISSTVVQPAKVQIKARSELQRYRQQVLCRSCQKLVLTEIEYRIGCGAWCVCCIMFFSGGFLCCFIPFLMKSCKDVIHRCPNCNVIIGRKSFV